MNLGHYDKPLYQEVDLAGKEKGIRSGFDRSTAVSPPRPKRCLPHKPYFKKGIEKLE